MFPEFNQMAKLFLDQLDGLHCSFRLKFSTPHNRCSCRLGSVLFMILGWILIVFYYWPLQWFTGSWWKVYLGQKSRLWKAKNTWVSAEDGWQNVCYNIWYTLFLKELHANCDTVMKGWSLYCNVVQHILTVWHQHNLLGCLWKNQFYWFHICCTELQKYLTIYSPRLSDSMTDLP